MDKQYRTRDGKKVRILCIDLASGHHPNHPVVTAITGSDGNEFIRMYHQDGRYTTCHEQSSIDLIEVQPWDNMKEGDICMVSDDGDKWHVRVFHSVCNNTPVAWEMTSIVRRWKYCQPFNTH